jgi:hypothetical protein
MVLPAQINYLQKNKKKKTAALNIYKKVTG